MSLRIPSFSHDKRSERGSRVRNGSASRLLLLFGASLIVVIGLIYAGLMIRPDARRGDHQDSLVRVYCASGIVQPVEMIIADYNQRFGTNVEIVRRGGSGELAGQIQTEFETGLEGGADLYITADEFLLAQAHEQGIVAERFSLARQKPVIAVLASNPMEATDLRETINIPGVKFGIASERAAVGKLTRKIASRDGFLETLENNKAVDSENVMTLAQSLVTGSLDAAVIWDTTVSQVNQANAGSDHLLKSMGLADPLEEFQSDIAVGVIAGTDNPTACLKFARFLTAPSTSRPTFEALGFTFVDGDVWEEVPEIHLYCGSMFTPVLEKAVRDFATREGVNVYPRWEGCGKLVASMKAIRDPGLFPDAYLACDMAFLEEVSDRFCVPVTISHNRIVMVTRKDLKRAVDGPRDLLESDLRIGICDPVQSALGKLTQQMLSSDPFDGVYDRLAEQASVTVDVGPTLMSQMLAGGLDVAFVYRSNVMASRQALEELEMIEIDSQASRSVATQPWAVSKSTKNAKLMERFFEWIQRPEIKARFEDHGFRLVE